MKKTPKTPKAQKAPAINPNNILDILSLIAAGKYPAGGSEPTGEMPPGFVSRGIVTRRETRNLYAATSLVKKAADRVRIEHFASHLVGNHSENSCEKAKMQNALLIKRAEALDGLMRISTHDEMVTLYKNDVAAVCKDWHLASSRNTSWNFGVMFPKKHIMTDLTKKVLAIVGGKVLSAKKVVIPIAMKKGEKVIGQVTDPRIKSLIVLSDKLLLAAEAFWPKKNGRRLDLESAAFEAWALKKGEEKLGEYGEIMDTIKKASDAVTKIFWVAIRDSIKDCPDSISLRKDWKVVEDNSPENSHQEEIEIIMHEAGKESVVDPDSIIGRSLLAFHHAQKAGRH